MFSSKHASLYFILWSRDLYHDYDASLKYRLGQYVFASSFSVSCPTALYPVLAVPDTLPSVCLSYWKIWQLLLFGPWLAFVAGLHFSDPILDSFTLFYKASSKLPEHSLRCEVSDLCVKSRISQLKARFVSIVLHHCTIDSKNTSSLLLRLQFMCLNVLTKLKISTRTFSRLFMLTYIWGSSVY